MQTKIKSALTLLHSMFFGKLNLLLFATNRCNSRCTICSVWKQERYDLPVKIIEDILKSKLVNGILLEGGEAILHPDINYILRLFQEKNVNYTLLSNGLLPENLEKLVRKYKVPSVSISIDGTRETYKKIRGVDGYDSAMLSVNYLRNITDVTVCFTISPQNTYEDYEQIKYMCDFSKIRLLTNVYCELEYSGHALKDKPIDSRYDLHPNPYVSLYNKWQQKEVNIGCSGIKFMCNIFPNGDITLCQPLRNFILGNLHNNTLDEIWNRNSRTRKHNSKCNACWVSCNRYIDARIWKLTHW